MRLKATISILILFLLNQKVFGQFVDSVFARPKLAAEYREGVELMRLYLKWNLKYPPAAALRKAEGRVWVSALIDTFGRVVEPRVVKGIAPDMDTAALTVVRNMTNWLPAYEDTGPVKSMITIPVDFSLKNYRQVDQGFLDTSANAPMYPGGPFLLITHLFSSVRYPKALEGKHIKGRVLVRFLVDEKGLISDPVIYKSLHPLLDTMALVSVSGMPRWRPAIEAGHAVRAFVVLPVPFDSEIPTFQMLLKNAPDKIDPIRIPRGMDNHARRANGGIIHYNSSGGSVFFRR